MHRHRCVSDDPFAVVPSSTLHTSHVAPADCEDPLALILPMRLCTFLLQIALENIRMLIIDDAEQSSESASSSSDDDASSSEASSSDNDGSDSDSDTGSDTASDS